MANKHETESVQKGNSSDTLLAIYVLRVLKKYSSPSNSLTVQDVIQHLQDDHSIGYNENEESQRKKVRRYLDTLCESYGKGCIVKTEGARKDGYKWYYDPSRDKFADEDGQKYETLSNVELELIIDLISATKILNAESTIGMIDKLLKKMSLSDEDRESRLEAIKKEKWTKNPNEYLLETKEIIQGYIDMGCRIRFDYDDNNFVAATPCGWIYADGKCFLKADVGDKRHQFLLDKIRNVEEIDQCTVEEFEYEYEENSSNNTSLESLFSNIPFIKGAIKEKRGIKFSYRSYAVNKNRVVLEDTAKNILPHSMVFNDGKYYLIGIDKDATSTSKIGYFRLDLIADLDYLETEITLSEWNKQVYETIQRAREVEKHPLMQAGSEITAGFWVCESALDKVRDAFGTSPIFQVAKESQLKTSDFAKQKWSVHDSISALSEGKLVQFAVKTTRDEALRWALANADVAELIYPSDIRYQLRRVAPYIHEKYIKTRADKVRAHADRVYSKGEFRISPNIGEDIAFESYKTISNEENIDAVSEIKIWNVNADHTSYLGDFKKTRMLDIGESQCKSIDWAANFTELVNISISYTLVENIAFLKNLKKLKVVCLKNSPISDLSLLGDHEEIRLLSLHNINVSDISFIEKYSKLLSLHITGCPISDYSFLLRIPPLDVLIIDPEGVDAIGMDNLIKHHPDALIKVQKQIDNRKYCDH